MLFAAKTWTLKPTEKAIKCELEEELKTSASLKNK